MNFSQVEFCMVWLVKPAIQLLVADKMKLLLKTTGIPDT